MSESWKEVAAFDDLRDEEATCIVAGGVEVALYRVGDSVYATDNICTHGQANLCDGFLEGFEIECPLHQGRFDVRTGEPVSGPVFVPLRRFPTKIENGRVFVDLA